MDYNPKTIARCTHDDMDDKSGHGDFECKFCGMYYTDIESIQLLRELANISPLQEEDIKKHTIDYGNEELTRQVAEQIEEDLN